MSSIKKSTLLLLYNKSLQTNLCHFAYSIHQIRYSLTEPLLQPNEHRIIRLDNPQLRCYISVFKGRQQSWNSLSATWGSMLTAYITSQTLKH